MSHGSNFTSQTSVPWAVLVWLWVMAKTTWRTTDNKYECICGQRWPCFRFRVWNGTLISESQTWGVVWHIVSSGVCICDKGFQNQSKHAIVISRTRIYGRTHALTNKVILLYVRPPFSMVQALGGDGGVQIAQISNVQHKLRTTRITDDKHIVMGQNDPRYCNPLPQKM